MLHRPSPTQIKNLSKSSVFYEKWGGVFYAKSPFGPFISHYQQKALQKLQPILNAKLNKKLSSQKAMPSYILDLGCGPAQLFSLLSQDSNWRKLRMIGVDSSSSMLGYAQKLHTQLEGESPFKSSDGRQSKTWLQIKAPELPIKKASIQWIWCSLVLHHYKSIKFWSKNIADALDSEGVFCLVDWMPEGSAWVWDKLAGLLGDGHYHFYSASEYKEALEESHFQLLADFKLSRFFPLHVLIFSKKR